MANAAIAARLDFARSPQIESLLNNWRVRYEYIEDYALDDIVDVQDQQVRDLANIARPETVEQYVQMARNSVTKWPPLIVAYNPNGKHAMIDGNTRRQAARELGQETVAVYVAYVNSLDTARHIGAGANQMGGVQLTEEEAMRSALRMLDGDYTDSEIAGNVGRSVSQVRSWRKGKEAEDHARKVGVSTEFEDVPPPQQKLFARVIQDRPFKALVDLASSRRIKQQDIKALVDDVVKAPGEEEALEMIRDTAEKIPAGGPSGRSDAGNPKARRMRMILPQLLNLNPPEELFEPDRAAEDRENWLKARRIVDDMLSMYSRRLDVES